MDKDKVIELDKKYYMPVFTRYPLVLSHGEGPYVWDTDGKKYLDFLAGIAVNVLGHNHPKLVQAISEQAGKIIHCSNIYYTEVQAKLIEKLASLSGMDKVFLANSGAEANEGAIKLARKYGKTIAQGKYEVISAQHSFHGRTLATLKATAQPKYHKGYEPLPEGFTYVPFNDLAALEKIISAKTCAVMLEPIQGEGGINLPDPDYLAGVRRLCDKHQALLLIDEIQSGMGRTGKFMAFQHYGVQPDIVTIAKGLGGGVPIGAFLATDKVASAFHPGDHGSTFGGNPLACAAANAVLTAYEEEKILDNAEEIGTYMLAALDSLAAKYPKLISEARGKGLMIGVQLTMPGKDIVAECMKQGVLINCTAGDVLRFVPPLNITKQQVDELMLVLDKVLAVF